VATLGRRKLCARENLNLIARTKKYRWHQHERQICCPIGDITNYEFRSAHNLSQRRSSTRNISVCFYQIDREHAVLTQANNGPAGTPAT
jgi:hypothetical protein